MNTTTITIEIKNMPVKDWKDYLKYHFKSLREIGYDPPNNEPINDKLEIDFNTIDMSNTDHRTIWSELMSGALSLKLNTDFFNRLNKTTS